MELVTFEDVTFNDAVNQLVESQLATGLYRSRLDHSPGDWLIRAWQALPEEEASRVATAVNQSLSHDSPDIRAEAVRTLDGCPKMADPDVLLSLAENQFVLFRGLRRSDDSLGTLRYNNVFLFSSGCGRCHPQIKLESKRPFCSLTTKIRLGKVGTHLNI